MIKSRLRQLKNLFRNEKYIDLSRYGICAASTSFSTKINYDIGGKKMISLDHKTIEKIFSRQISNLPIKGGD